MNSTVKFSIGFLVGVLFMAVVMVQGGIRHGLPVFVAGVLTVVAPVVAYCSSVERVGKLARFLNGFVEGHGSATQRTQASLRRRGSNRPLKTDSDRWEEAARGLRMPNARTERRAVKESEENAAFFSDPELFEMPKARRSA